MTAILARDIMTKNVLTVSDEWSLQELARFLTDHGISGAPVTNAAGNLVGVVSVTDVARATGDLAIDWVEPANLYEHDARLSSDDLGQLAVEAQGETCVKDIMTSVVFEVQGSDTVDQIAHTMVTGRIHRVFVVEQGRVVGVVSALDLLGVLAH